MLILKVNYFKYISYIYICRLAEKNLGIITDEKEESDTL
jgi:hypothetical protein